MSRPKSLKGTKGSKRDLDRALSCIADFTEAAQYALRTGNPREASSAINALSGHVTHAAGAAGEWSALVCVVDGTYMDPRIEEQAADEGGS